MIEVLSPAGSFEAVEAAARSGADAVYFGAGGFNARRNAKNFTAEDIKNTAEYCRVRGVKTYLTLNTLISDKERLDALRLAFSAAESGIDALIVQDIGLARLLRLNLPGMPLHASTQMSVHSARALSVLKEMGFCRVVPAREADRETLKTICAEAAALGMEVEVFVHGALCMCMSGQCYLSSMLGGRSGNRGLCAQPCRLPFAVKNGTGHDLSLKDMSYIPLIGRLAEMGVCSFKIEGRMKRPEYVAAATAAARAAADGKEISTDIAEALSGVFSRSGHTDGYFKNKLGVGMFGIRTENDEVLSKKVLTSTHGLYRTERQSIALEGTLIVNENEPMLLSVTDRDGNSAEVKGSVPEAAKSVAVTAEVLKAKIEKLGGTCYYFDELTVKVEDGLAVSGGELGALRKQAVERISALRARFAPKAETVRSDGMTESTVKEIEPKTVAQFRSIEQMPDELTDISAVIFPVETDFSVLKGFDIPIIAEIPRGIMHNGEKISELLKEAAENGVKAALCQNIAAFPMAKEAGLVPVAGFGMNIYNSDSVKAVGDMGAEAAVVSFEASLEDAVRLGGDCAKGIISYGRLPLMLFRNCPGKNGNGCAECDGRCALTDRKGIEFPVMCRGEFSEMYNSRPVWMLDRRGELKGLDFQVLLFTDETKERCREVIKAAAFSGKSDIEHTRGLYYREVL